METPDGLRYTEEHEWVDDLGDGRYRIGITDFAQDQLGDVVFVDLPEVGREVAVGEAIAELESTKSVAELFAPVAGTVAERNDALIDAPETINAEPYGGGWFVVIESSDASLDEFMDASAYAAFTADD